MVRLVFTNTLLLALVNKVFRVSDKQQVDSMLLGAERSQALPEVTSGKQLLRAVDAIGTADRVALGASKIRFWELQFEQCPILDISF
jgi:hypothetical protein